MVNRSVLAGLLASVSLLLHGCNYGKDAGGESTTTPEAPDTTTATTTASGPTNTWCSAPEAASAVAAAPPAAGQPIGWHPTGQTVGNGHWCQVGVPAANWHLSSYCSGSGAAVVAREGFTVERFLRATVDANATASRASSARLKVLTYNLYWWHLFGQDKGENGAAGKNIASHAKPETFDLMGFQECEDVAWPLRDAKSAGMEGEFATVVGGDAIALAYRKEAFELLEQGVADVAEDGPAQHFGRRSTVWVRLTHKASHRPVFFINHHGPTPVNSGGVCGSAATAYNLLKVIAENAKVGDAVILVGDFNAWSNDPQGKWLEEVGKIDCHLPHVFSNPVIEDVWGIDNVFASCLKTVETTVMPKGGSDHNALSVVFEI